MFMSRQIALPAMTVTGLCLLLGVFFLLRATPLPDLSGAGQDQSGVTLSSIGFSAAALKSYDPVIKRPLFSPSRRAVLAQETSNAPAGRTARALSSLTLTGTIIDDMSSIALFESSKSGGQISIALGEAVDGWRLVEVTPRTVHFEKAGKRTALRLNFEETRPQRPFSIANRSASKPKRGRRGGSVDAASVVDEVDG